MCKAADGESLGSRGRKLRDALPLPRAGTRQPLPTQKTASLSSGDPAVGADGGEVACLPRPTHKMTPFQDGDPRGRTERTPQSQSRPRGLLGAKSPDVKKEGNLQIAAVLPKESRGRALVEVSVEARKQRH